MYNSEIIHFIGGVHDYIGELDQSEHPMGKNWYRIKKPCITFSQRNEEKQRVDNVVASMVGPHKTYRKFVDIRVPEDSIMEIRVLDKNGDLYKFYQKESNRVSPSLIVMPDSDVVTDIR